MRISLGKLLLGINIIGLLGLWSYSNQQGFSFWHIINNPGLAIIVSIFAMGAMFIVFILFYLFTAAQQNITQEVRKNKILNDDGYCHAEEVVGKWNEKASNKSSGFIFKWLFYPLLLMAVFQTINVSYWWIDVGKVVAFSLPVFAVFSFLFTNMIYNYSTTNKVKFFDRFRWVKKWNMLCVFFLQLFLLFFISVLVTSIAAASVYNLYESLSSHFGQIIEFNDHRRGWGIQVVIFFVLQFLAIWLITWVLKNTSPGEYQEHHKVKEENAADTKIHKGPGKIVKLMKEGWPDAKAEILAPIKSWSFIVVSIISIGVFWLSNGAANTTKNALNFVGAASPQIKIKDLKREGWSAAGLYSGNKDFSYEESMILNADSFALIFKGKSDSIVRVRTCKESFKDAFEQCDVYENRLFQIPSDSPLLRTYKVL